MIEKWYADAILEGARGDRIEEVYSKTKMMRSVGVNEIYL
jgi:hypothetical protein